ncbi:hypothetical protein PHMEG_00020293 [Phytophthora megakarya]|uniref:Uncharacterized protein n=1 Tax=Phytophthora megakarya TaxID=4795 RepID=A0A225VPR9_9STRA|nr:hypothetical protein PHMEG_00020293 [Phytophthora megakarya]
MEYGILYATTKTRVVFCTGKSYSRSTLQYWERHLQLMRLAVRDKRRGKKLMVGGSGRVSPSWVVEDAMCNWIKDEGRKERPPLGLGVMTPFKSSLKDRYTELYSKTPPPSSGVAMACFVQCMHFAL